MSGSVQRLTREMCTRHTAKAVVVAVIVAASASACSSSVLDLKAGDCFTQPDTEEVTNISTLSCQNEHDAEVVGTVTIEQDTRPDDASLNDFAQQQCLSLFETYVGVTYAQSSLGLTWLVPTASSWKNDDDRTVTCVALAPEDQTMTQSVKDLKL